VEPYALFNGREAWYVAAYEGELKHFRLDRIKRAVALVLRSLETRERLKGIALVGKGSRRISLRLRPLGHERSSTFYSRQKREVQALQLGPDVPGFRALDLPRKTMDVTSQVDDDKRALIATREQTARLLKRIDKAWALSALALRC
jgi:hypothetical protein